MRRKKPVCSSNLQQILCSIYGIFSSQQAAPIWEGEVARTTAENTQCSFLRDLFYCFPYKRSSGSSTWQLCVCRNNGSQLHIPYKSVWGLLVIAYWANSASTCLCCWLVKHTRRNQQLSALCSADFLYKTNTMCLATRKCLFWLTVSSSADWLFI